MKNEIFASFEGKNAAVKQSRLKKLMRGICGAGTAASVMAASAVTSASQVFAAGDDFGSVTVNDTSNTSASGLMGKIIGVLLTITRYVGVALVIYGVYEIVMSFMQNQPEAKTKGIIMALAGVVMVGLKSIIVGLGLIS